MAKSEDKFQMTNQLCGPSLIYVQVKYDIFFQLFSLFFNFILIVGLVRKDFSLGLIIKCNHFKYMSLSFFLLLLQLDFGHGMIQAEPCKETFHKSTTITLIIC